MTTTMTPTIIQVRRGGALEMVGIDIGFAILVLGLIAKDHFFEITYTKPKLIPLLSYQNISLTIAYFYHCVQ